MPLMRLVELQASEIERLREALERITRDCTARKAVMIARAALTPNAGIHRAAEGRPVE